MVGGNAVLAREISEAPGVGLGECDSLGTCILSMFVDHIVGIWW